MNKNTLSIVIPVYNEEKSITETIIQIEKIMGKTGIRYEIIIVNDGSGDGTSKILEKFLKERKAKNNRIRIFNHEENRGYGASLKTGILQSKYDNICITDADSTYPNDRIPELFREYGKNYHMVVGQRPFKKLPTITKPAKWFINKLANYLVGHKIPDINSGLRIFRKEIAVKYFPIICDGFSFTSTITLSMLSNNYRVKYIPIDYLKRKGKSKIKPFKDTFNFIQLIIRTVLYFNPLKVLLNISILLWVVSVVFFILGRNGVLFQEVPNDTITILFVSGIQIFVTGMIADLIVKRMN